MHEDEHLRDLMLAVDVPPTTADIGLAIATGRRQARRGSIVAGAAAALVVAAGTTYALGVTAPGGGDRGVQAGPPTDASYADCTVDVLDVTGPAGSPAVDPAGRTVVGTVGGVVVRFDDGRAVPYPGATGEVVAVNDAGVIAGYDEVDQASHMLAWTYRNGTKTMLAKLPGYDYTFPTAVNARGDVVGGAMGEANDDTVPVLWPADQPGKVRALAMPAGYGHPNTGGSQAVGLTDDGVVVGNVHGAPVRWSPDGTPSLLPTPPGHEYATVMVLRGGIVYGMAAVIGENRVVALRWDMGIDLVTVLVGVPYDVTDGTPGGWMITTGGDYNQPTRVTPQRTVERLPLPPGVLLPPNGPGAVATTISDDGRTITGATAADDRRPLVWHC
ncbi:hypothetical protein OHA72_32635 [Dactylosporangium sp. NBC_01737]|uniref:hypothetical protein n=1 Tax=Dactylosporangium sp. NBC_01737 TaxID=2975959 RepID=UPI002E10956C|nr:hypothetical protein OHA72_32635 [Dactylosporangium sp. NBC_01737]